MVETELSVHFSYLHCIVIVHFDYIVSIRKEKRVVIQGRKNDRKKKEEKRCSELVLLEGMLMKISYLFLDANNNNDVGNNSTVT